MNAAHLHLLLNHVPVIGTIGVILLLAYGLFRRSDEVTRASAAALVVLGVLAVAVYLTGEPAEELVENLAGVSEDTIEAHEEAALLATALLAAVGAMALGGMIYFRDRIGGLPRTFASILLAGSLVAAGAMGWTANLGGQIRHTEIRSAPERSFDEAPADFIEDDEGAGYTEDGEGEERGERW